MATSTQFWSIADGSVFLADQGGEGRIVDNPEVLNTTQQARVAEAMGLWDDVSGFTAIERPDDDNLARDSTTTVAEIFSAFPLTGTGRARCRTTGPASWWATFGVTEIAGTNKASGADSHYHEVYIDTFRDGGSPDGLGTFELGSDAFHTLVHELGHSVLEFPPLADGGGEHIRGHMTATVMDPKGPPLDDPEQPWLTWLPSTPMTLDIDAAIRQFGAATTTRTGDDTYGFNASFSGPYRAAFDFDVNTRPLVTIYDNGVGIDTLDASGFRDPATGAPRGVHVDLNPGGHSYTIDGKTQTFAVIYQGEGPTTWIENAVGGGGNDVLIGNSRQNTLRGGEGHDRLDGLMDGYVDNLIGGNGNDTYSVTEYENVIEFEGGGTDTIETASTVFFLQDNVENLRYSGNTDASLYFVGNGLDNTIEGRAGDDYLIGDNGNDVLNGGAGGDTMDGGNGNDTYTSTTCATR